MLLPLELLPPAENRAAPPRSSLGGGGEDSVGGFPDLTGDSRLSRRRGRNPAESFDELAGIDLLLGVGSPRHEIEGILIAGVAVSDFPALIVIGFLQRV